MVRRLLNPRQAIRALRFAGFRWFILGRVAGSPTGQMRQVVQGWLVYQIADSALALGWVSTVRALVMVVLAPLIVGLLAVLLIVTYTTMGLVSPKLRKLR